MLSDSSEGNEKVKKDVRLLHPAQRHDTAVKRFGL